MTWLILLLSAYLLGSLPTAYLVAKYVGGFDIRTRGSGNVGTTNAFRTLGTGPGLLVLAVDALKGFLPALAGSWLAGPWLAFFGALAAMAGHNWSIFLKFQGGRGVAAAAGALLAMSPPVLLWAVAIFLAAVFLTRYVSLGSLLGAAAAPALMLVYNQPAAYLLFALLAAAFIVYRHRPNIQRLLRGTEHKFGERR